MEVQQKKIIIPKTRGGNFCLRHYCSERVYQIVVTLESRGTHNMGNENKKSLLCNSVFDTTFLCPCKITFYTINTCSAIQPIVRYKIHQPLNNS